MPQLMGGRKRQNTEMEAEAASGTLDRTLPSSSRKREQARFPCPTVPISVRRVTPQLTSPVPP